MSSTSVTPVTFFMMQCILTLCLFLSAVSCLLPRFTLEELTQTATSIESSLILIDHLQKSPETNWFELKALRNELLKLSSNFYKPEVLAPFCELQDDDPMTLESLLLNAYRVHTSNPWAEKVEYAYIDRKLLKPSDPNSCIDLKTIRSDPRMNREVRRILSDKESFSKLFKQEGRDFYYKNYKEKTRYSAGKHLLRHVKQMILDEARAQTGVLIDSFENIPTYATCEPKLDVEYFSRRTIKEVFANLPFYKFTKKTQAKT